MQRRLLLHARVSLMLSVQYQPVTDQLILSQLPHLTFQSPEVMVIGLVGVQGSLLLINCFSTCFIIRL